MPYKRTYKKKTYARKSYPRKSNLAREVRLIKRTIKPELKLLYPDPPVGSVTATPVYTPLNFVSPGTGLSQRVGQQIACKSIRVHFQLNRNASSTVAFNRVRLMLVWFKQPDGYALTDDELFGPALTGDPDRFTDWPGRKTFKVLYDKVYALSELYPVRTIRIAKKLTGVTEFDDTISGMGLIQTGALYMVSMSDVASNAPVISQPYGRMFYTDC